MWLNLSFFCRILASRRLQKCTNCLSVQSAPFVTFHLLVGFSLFLSLWARKSSVFSKLNISRYLSVMLNISISSVQKYIIWKVYGSSTRIRSLHSDQTVSENENKITFESHLWHLISPHIWPLLFFKFHFYWNVFVICAQNFQTPHVKGLM